MLSQPLSIFINFFSLPSCILVTFVVNFLRSLILNQKSTIVNPKFPNPLSQPALPVLIVLIRACFAGFLRRSSGTTAHLPISNQKSKIKNSTSLFVFRKRIPSPPPTCSHYLENGIKHHQPWRRKVFEFFSIRGTNTGRFQPSAFSFQLSLSLIVSIVWVRQSLRS